MRTSPLQRPAGGLDRQGTQPPRHSGLRASDRGLPAPPTGPAVLAVHGAGGGVGTTTLAAEITTFLARAGRRVVAIDSDLDRGSLHYRLDVPVGRTTFSLADVLEVLDDVSCDVLSNGLSRCSTGACLLPAPPLPRRLSCTDVGRAARLVSALGASFDHVVIDTRPAFDELTAGLLAASHIVLLVATPELGCLGGARRAIGSLAAFPGGGPEVTLVVNRSLGPSDLVSTDELVSLLGIRPARVLPEDAARCRRLANECRPLASERSVLSRETTSLINDIFAS
jgi:Flp pilus assembly CpaE family ATPase